MIHALLLLACDTPPPASAPVDRAEVPPPVVVEEPAPPPPEPEEVCDDAGWCRPFHTFTFTVAAAAEAAVAEARREMVAVWADGRWQGGFAVDTPVRLLDVERSADAIAVTACGDECTRREITQGTFGPPTVVPRPPKKKQWHKTIGQWAVSYSSVYRAGPLGPERFFVGCAVRLDLLGGPESPFAICQQHSAASLLAFDGVTLREISQPWSSTWVPNPVAVHHGSDCEPCIVGGMHILVKEEHGWTQRPLPPGGIVDPTEPMPEHTIAEHGTRMRWGGKRWRWDGADWVADTEEPSSWAEASPKLEIDQHRPPRDLPGGGEDYVQAFATPEALVVVINGNDLLWRQWDRFLAPDASQVWSADVRGVAADDKLNVRAGPHPSARAVATLPPDARCVRVLAGQSDLTGGSWQPIETGDGMRGWVNARFLKRNTSCP